MLPKLGIPADDIFAASGAAGNKAWFDLAQATTDKFAPSPSQANFAVSKILF